MPSRPNRSPRAPDARMLLPALRERIARYYEVRVAGDWKGKHLFHGRRCGPDAIQLQSNDYLAIADHPEILESHARAVLEHGSGLMMSTIFLHGASPQRDFEQAMAEFLGFEDVVLCQSGYAANVGLLQAIAGPKTPVYLDRIAHMSLWEGARAARAPTHGFRHSDPGHLDEKIRAHGPGIVVVDSVYSTDGSVCPLREVSEIAQASGSVFVVDESHSLGTHGVHGEGLVTSLGIGARVDFLTASLSKAFSSRGGLVACPAAFHDYFTKESYPVIFSSAVLPHEAVGFLAALEVIRSEDWRRDRLRKNAARLRRELQGLGFESEASESQIIPLVAGSEYEVIRLRECLESRGVFGAPFGPPGCAPDRCFVRLSVHARLSDEQLDRIVYACRRSRDELARPERRASSG